MSYEKVTQWLAGPFAVGIGFLSTALLHQNITHSAAVNAATFVISSGATILAHNKWLDGAAKWAQTEAYKLVNSMTPEEKSDATAALPAVEDFAKQVAEHLKDEGWVQKGLDEIESLGDDLVGDEPEAIRPPVSDPVTTTAPAAPAAPVASAQTGNPPSSTATGDSPSTVPAG